MHGDENTLADLALASIFESVIPTYSFVAHLCTRH